MQDVPRVVSPRRNRRINREMVELPEPDEFDLLLDAESLDSDRLRQASYRVGALWTDRVQQLCDTQERAIGAIESLHFGKMKPGLADRYRHVKHRMVKHCLRGYSDVVWSDPQAAKQQGELIGQLTGQLLDVDLGYYLPESILYAVKCLRHHQKVTVQVIHQLALLEQRFWHLAELVNLNAEQRLSVAKMGDMAKALRDKHDADYWEKVDEDLFWYEEDGHCYCHDRNGA